MSGSTKSALDQMWDDLARAAQTSRVHVERKLDDLGAEATANGVTLYVRPRTELIDYPTNIVVSGLEPLQTIVIGVRSTDAAGLTWTGSLGYWASGNGEVNPAIEAIRLPTKYSSLKDWAGLFHTMAPDGRFTTGQAYSWNDEELRPFTFTVTDQASGRELVSCTIERGVRHDGETMTEQTVRKSGFYGKFFQPKDPSGESNPAVLIFGGSEGGLYPTLERAASLLAARGHPALALAYFAGPSLPTDVNRTLPQALANISLGYFTTAITWLGHQPGVDKSKIFVCGTSRGSEAALLLGALYPGLIHGVIANVPTNVVGPALTSSNQLNPWAPAWTYHKAPLMPGTKIPVDRIKATLFLDSARVDRMWGASGTDLVDQIEALRPQRNRDVVHRYTGAGHGLGVLVPYLPHVFADSVGSTLQGITAFANRVDDAWLWPNLLGFLAH